MNDVQRPNLRRVGPVLAGLAVVIILSTVTDVVMQAAGIFPPFGDAMSDKQYLLAFAYRCVYTVMGGYVTARLASNRPMKHVLTLGLIGIVLSIAGVIVGWSIGHHWYPVILAASALPLTWAGGKLRGGSPRTTWIMNDQQTPNV